LFYFCFNSSISFFLNSSTSCSVMPSLSLCFNL